MSMTDERETTHGRCLLCGAVSRERLFAVSERFVISRCRSCDVAWTDPPVQADEIGEFYPPVYYGARNQRFNPLFEWLVASFRHRRVRRLEGMVPRGTALDIGCGRGITLAGLKEEGWRVFGVELSENAAAMARDVLGKDAIFVGDVLDAPWPDSSFDLVIVWHVLEHVPDPKAVLRKCRAFLRPGGLLVVAVPNFESLQARLTGASWFHLDVPRHYWHFGSRVLLALLAENDFEIRQLGHLSIEQNLYGWIQSLLNRIGFPYNLLYDSVKRPSARTLARPFHSHPLASLLLLPALLVVVPISLILFVVEALLRRGGTIEVYATCRK